MAVSTVAKPVMRTISPWGDAARSGRMRSTPVASGSFTSTMATSNPSRVAAANARLPLGSAGHLDLELARPLQDVGEVRREVEVVVDDQNRGRPC